MANSNQNRGSKFNINIGKISDSSDIQIGDRTYYNNQPQQTANTPKRTILLLASSPINTARLRLDKEAREIKEGLQRSNHRDQFHFEQQWAVRPSDLRRSLLDHSPQIVHFCGHGVGESGLVLEDDTGRGKIVSTEALAGLFKLFADQIECVVLNACYSQEQAEAIAQQVPFVVGMSDAVKDSVATEFAVGFYDALAAGRTYEDAFEFGKVAIALEGLPQEQIPVLLKKSG